jgi:hypothetical protein
MQAKRLITEGKKYFFGRSNYQVNFDMAFQLFNEAVAKDPSNNYKQAKGF